MLHLIRLAQPLLPSEEYPKLKSFSIHPGGIKTQLTEGASDGIPDDVIWDSVQLPTATMLYLTSGQLDWLNGK